MMVWTGVCRIGEKNLCDYQECRVTNLLYIVPMIDTTILLYL